MTSVFLSYKCQTPPDESPAPQLLAWSKTDTLLAVSFDNAKIRFYQDEGRVVEEAVINLQRNATAMEWQPKGKVLAIGNLQGNVSSWVWQDRNVGFTYSNQTVHSTAIVFLLWNPLGTRLVTGDKGGVLCVWKADTKGSLTPALQYKKNSPLTRVVFATMPQANIRTDVVSKALSPSFFFGTESGVVSYADDLGHCSEVQSLATSVDAMAFYEEKMRLVIITRSLFLSQLQVGDDGRVTPVMKVKLSISGDALEAGVSQVVWAGPGLLATASGESVVRMWDVANEENYVLSLSSAGHGMTRSDQAVSLAFNPIQRYLAVGTKEGKVLMWSFRGEYAKGNQSETAASTGPQDWEPAPPTIMEGRIRLLAWGPGKGSLAACNEAGAHILDETLMQRMLNDGVAVIQLNSDSVKIEHQEEGTYDIRSRINIKGIAVNKKSVAFWNGKQAEVYELQSDAVVPLKSFATTATAMAIRGDTLYRAVETKVEICNLQGVIRQSVSFTEAEGRPVLLDINNHFMAVTTDTGLIKIFDIKGREPKQIGSSGRFVDARTGESLGVIRSVRCNADGTRVSLLSDVMHGGALKIREPDMRLHMYDADRDVVVHYDFTKQKRYPISHFWDPEEPKLLACEIKRFRGGAAAAAAAAASTGPVEKAPVLEKGLKPTPRGSKKDLLKPPQQQQADKPSREADETMSNGRGSSSSLDLSGTGADEEGRAGSSAEVEVVTLLATADYGILMQDTFPLVHPLDALLGLHVPKLYFTAIAPPPTESMKLDDTIMDEGNQITLMTRTMRDFMGLDDLDDETRKALMDFSYYLTVRNMDEAYRAVKLIRNSSVWENMAHMCVKTKRLDVAEICLGNMGHARGAAAVRLTKRTEPELEAVMATVAIQLGLVDDAAALFKECGRVDLLNNLYQASGSWDKALQLAKKQDRIHLRTTHFKYARYLEATGDTNGAIRHYEQADAHRMEVPRMLFKSGRLNELEDYVLESDDQNLLKWWGSYCESLGHFDKARKMYNRAGDYLNLVRLSCYSRDFRSAEAVVNESKDKSAAYHLARQFEINGDVHNAITYYAQSGCYNHSIRLAKRYGLDAELMSFALKSRESLMVDCAKYFEEKEEFEKAVQLYHKGGDIPRALDLCFKAGHMGRTAMFDVLTTIAEGLGENTSPQVLARCAEFFIEHGQNDKAVGLFILGKKYSQAIDLCLNQRVKITEELAEKLSPPEEGKGVGMGQEERLEVMKQLAKACKQQGSYQLACKKYTQAGERLKALKCLLKSGDTKSVLYYASVSRNRDIYILAANYLQNLDWHTDPEIMKAIINFYTKAKAFEQLSGFYDACAQVEIDEYRDYDKAVGALKEAAKHMAKSRGPNKDRLLTTLQQRIMQVERFVQARHCAKSNPEEMVKTCHELLDTPGIEGSIRVGDCFAMLVEYNFARGDMREAYRLIEQMRERRIVINPYLEREMVVEIHRSLNIPLGPDEGHDEEEDEDEGVEEVDEDEEDQDEAKAQHSRQPPQQQQYQQQQRPAGRSEGAPPRSSHGRRQVPPSEQEEEEDGGGPMEEEEVEDEVPDDDEEYKAPPRK